MAQDTSSSNPVRIGLVGYGAWGKFHARSIAASERTELVAIAARSDETRAGAAEDYPEADIYADWHDLIARDDIEAVDIVLPTHLHYEVAAAALDAGKHLLLEKPVSPSLAECKDLVDRAERGGLVYAVGHELRIARLWSEPKHAIERGEVGTPSYVLVELSRRPYRPGAEGWRFDIDRVGSWVLEEPIHFLDLARWYLESVGDPVSVYASASSMQEGHPELRDNFSCIVHFEGGAYAVVTQTLGMFEHHQTAKLAATEGAVWASWSGAMDRTDKPTHSLRVMRGPGPDSPVEEIELPVTGEIFELREEIDLFVQAVREGTAVPADGRDGLWSVGLCLAAEESLRTGAPVDIREFLADYL